MKNRQLILLEDDETLAWLLSEFLSTEGYILKKISKGSELFSLPLNSYELLLLDINLGEDNGFDILKKLRKSSDIPVIIISAFDQDLMRIKGLQLGADDYVCKPFNHIELTARIEAVLKRYRIESKAPNTGGLSISIKASKREVYFNSDKIELTDIEFRILECLINNIGKVTSREFIYQRVFKREEGFSSRPLDIHISSLRKKLRGQAGRDLIVTSRGNGYMIIDVE